MIVLLPFLLLLVFDTARALPDARPDQPLTAPQARALIAPFYQALNAGNDAAAVLARMTSADWVSCSGNDACRSRDQVGIAIAALQNTIPDLAWTIREVLVSGDRVIVRGEATGTPAQPFMGVAPGGARFRIMSLDVHTIENGRIVRTYHLEDWMGAVRQLSSR